MENIIARAPHLVDKLKTISETSDKLLIESVNSVLQHHEHFVFLVHEAVLNIRAKARDAEASAPTIKPD